MGWPGCQGSPRPGHPVLSAQHSGEMPFVCLFCIRSFSKEILILASPQILLPPCKKGPINSPAYGCPLHTPGRVADGAL